MSDASTTSSPPVTEAMRRSARARPGSWIYVVDPAFDPDGEVPPEGVVGAYPVDQRGEIGEQFTANPRYRPTPRGLGLPEPTDALDAAVQGVVTGWTSDEQLLDHLVDGTVWLLAGPDRQVFVAERPGGRGSVWVFSDPSHAERQAPGHEVQEMTVEEILAVVPAGVDLTVNPGAAVTVDIPVAEAASAVARSGR